MRGIARRIRVIMGGALLLTAATVLPARPASVSTVEAYPAPRLDAYSNYTAAPIASTAIGMTVGGTSVPVVDTLDFSVARFAANGPVSVQLTIPGGVTTAVVRPSAYGIATTRTATTVQFTLPQPEEVAVDLNGTANRLLIFADPIDSNPPSPSDANVKNVTDFSGISTTGAVSTSGLQTAINWVSSNHATKNILYFPAGVYRTATLSLADYVQVYLAPGAVLIADGAAGDYQQIADPYGDQTNVSALLLLRGVHDVKIFGRGQVNANGYNLYAANAFNLRLETLYADQGTYNVTVQDVLVTNSDFYQTHFQGSHDIALTNVKLYNPEGGPSTHKNDDGFKTNASQNVTFTGGFIMSRDDTVTTAACCGAAATHDESTIKVTNTVLDGTGYPAATVRFAYTDYGHTVSGVTMTNIYDIGDGRGAIYRIVPSGTQYDYVDNWGGVTLQNWHIESNAPLFDFDVRNNTANVTISKLLLKDFTVQATSGSHIYGAAGKTFDDIDVQDVVVAGTPATTPADLGLTTNAYVTNLSVGPGTANIAPGATASTTSIRAGDSAASAIDGSATTFFKSAAGPSFPQYVTLTWPGAQLLSAVTLTCDHCSNQGLKNWDVQTSVDGTTGWTTVASSGDTTWAAGDTTIETKRLAFTPVTGQHGLRLQINSAYLTYGQYQVDDVAVASSNIAPIATATTTSLRSGDTASAVNDGTTATFFKSAPNPAFPQYLTLTWPTPQSASAAALTCDHCANQGLKNWDVQVSSDGTSGWNTVTSSGDITWAYGDATRETKNLTFPRADGIRGLRLRINSAYLTYGQYQVDELTGQP